MGVDGGLPPVGGPGFGVSDAAAYPMDVPAFEQLGPRGVGDAVARWLRLVAADAELSPYLVGVDLPRLGGHLALQLTAALGGPAGDIARPTAGAWQGLGLSPEQHRRVVDYLTGTLTGLGVSPEAVAVVGRVFADEVA
ncbi:hypothetical protein GCM10027290_11960 [Micromonospora sonneratiae]